MSYVTGALIYLIIWWTVLFAVLPWGVKPPVTVELGHDQGAPAHPRLKLKFILTSCISALIWLFVNHLINSRFIRFD